jgi:GDP-4-dehydro-6-deoxy-D-mannose reductase
VNPYALAKAVADVTAQVMGESHGLDIVRTRSFGHAGRGQTTRFLLPALAQQLAAIEAGHAEPRLKVGNLDVIRDLCDVRDVVAAYLLLIDRGRSGTAYNVCRGTGVQLKAVVSELVALAGVEVEIETESARLRPTDVPYLVGDPTRIERAVDWRPTIPLSETLREVLDEWRSNL